MPRRLVVSAVWLLCIAAPAVGSAQAIAPRNRNFWITGALTMAVTVPLDERINAFALRHQSASLDRIAVPIGMTANPRHILPMLAAGMVIPLLFDNRALSASIMDIGLGYAMATGVGLLLRPAIGRHRPDDTGQSARFSPFRIEHEWNAFPSGHTLTVMSLAAGISMKTRQPWVTTVAYGLATLVGLQRIYVQEHWASDVVAGAVIGIAASATTVRWRERRRSGGD